jgi:hypothetical protein
MRPSVSLGHGYDYHGPAYPDRKIWCPTPTRSAVVLCSRVGVVKNFCPESAALKPAVEAERADPHPELRDTLVTGGVFSGFGTMASAFLA